MTSSTRSSLKALALTCSLKPSPAPSSSQLLAEQVLDELAAQGVSGDSVRVVDFDVRPGVQTDMGDGDQWPQIRQKMLDADLLIFATPTWLGQMSSVAQRVLERLDAELSETDEQGRLLTYGKVAVVAVVGNEDGAHKIIADSFQALNDVGFTIPASAGVYWNSTITDPKDYNDLEETPEAVAKMTSTAVTNAIHLAEFLKEENYPPSAK